MSKYILPLSLAFILITYDQYRYYKDKILVENSIINLDLTKLINNNEVISSLKQKLTTLEIDARFVEDELKEQISEIRLETTSSTAVFDINKIKGYQIVNTKQGRYFVSIEKHEPYLKGYKISFKIGNPYTAELYDTKITLKWGKSIDQYEKEKQEATARGLTTAKSWYETLNENEFIIKTPIQASSWNVIEIILDAVTIEELQTLIFTFEPDTIFLATSSTTSVGTKKIKTKITVRQK